MNKNQEEHKYTFRRTKLSALYEEIGKYLREHGDADVRSIASLNGDSEASYRLELADLNTFDTRRIGEIKAKYEDVPYTKEEWESGVVNVPKVDKKVCNLLEVGKCCLRENDLCGKTKTCEHCTYTEKIKKLWMDFCDTPVDYKHGGYITRAWNNFPIGTFRADIVDWFYKTFEVDIGFLKKITGKIRNVSMEE